MYKGKDVELRLGRAKKHLASAHQQLRQWQADEHSGLVFLRDPDVSSDAYLLQVSKLPGDDFILDVCDFLANAQSTLDYVAWSLYLEAGGDPASPKAKNVYFPILSEEQTWARATKELRWLWREAEEVLRGEQDDCMEEPDDTLFMLKKLTNSQKHRALHLIGLANDRSASMTMPRLQEGHALAMSVSAETPALDGNSAYLLARYDVHSSGDPECKPLPRTPETTIEQPPAPTFFYGLTDGQFSIGLGYLGAMLERVERIAHVAATIAPFTRRDEADPPSLHL